MKKILILSITAGDGHNAIGNAVKEKLLSLGYVVEFIDIIKQYSTKTAFNKFDKGYLFVCQYFIGIYNFVYKILSKKNPKHWHKVTGQKIVKNITPKLYNELLTFKPDAVICTHVYAAIAMSNLHRTFNLPWQTFGILTDYMVHPFWEAATKINYLLLASSSTINPALNKGFIKNQLIVTGIPVSKKHLKFESKESSREFLQLQQNVFTILIIFSKARFKNIKKMVMHILKTNKNIQLIIVNGKNEKYKKIIDKLILKNNYINVLNLAYVNYLHTCISASDVVVSKAGVATVNETLNKHLPLLVYCKVAEQENANVNYLVENKASIKIKNLNHLCSVINKCATDQSFLNNLQSNIIKIKKPNACNDIVNLIKNTETNYLNSYSSLPKYEFKTIKNKIKWAIKKDVAKERKKQNKIK